MFKIILSVVNVVIKLFFWKVFIKMRNFLIKLLVLGEFILVKVEEKKMVGRFGMVFIEFL